SWAWASHWNYALPFSCKEYRNALDELSKASLKSTAEEGIQANSLLENRPKSSSPIRLPETTAGQSNRAAEAEQRKTVLEK
uniref:Uncharacterized protein n=1 Tax=Sphenodon punctatus TaxID=8508 RepID=A0A8D0GJK4_SPHPU